MLHIITEQTLGQLQATDPEYLRLVTQISDLWENAKNKAALAANTELIDANWQTDQYIIEFEQGGNVKAKYGDWLLASSLIRGNLTVWKFGIHKHTVSEL